MKLTFIVQDETVDEALVRLRERGLLQPCLFACQQQYFLKVDNLAIALPRASCFAEAIEQVFMAFFVFNVQFPNNLRVFYTFIGFLVNVGQKLGCTVRDFLRELKKY